ncbi:MAG: Smr/MutS family protein [Prolixibacteraceae bacterium]|nr:Smr/MutS family protein [Prolixibacteraceae bacterium]
MPAIYPNNFEQKIGFDRIRQMLSANCLSEIGREKVEAIAFLTRYDDILHQTGLVNEFLIILRTSDQFPTNHFYDMRQALRKIKIEGTYLEVVELFNLRRSLETVRAIVNFFKGDNGERFPLLKALSGDVILFDEVLKQIDQLLNKQGAIKDNASPELQHIRSQLFSLQGSISKKMQTILRHLMTEGIVDEDTTVAIRDGRPVIPVVAANKKKLNGIVHDESATGKTAFIEPAEIVELNNRLRELENAEKREIIRILIQFSDALRPSADDLLISYDFMGEIDFVRSKALFARQFECIKPDIRNEPRFEWYHARHPLLMQALKRENREVVPLTIRFDDDQRILLISGPNAGGKSVCLKTVGLIQYMLQCGLLVPVVEGSKTGIFKSIFIDIGDEQSIDNDLSTYSSHLMNMKFFVQHCNRHSLVLIDEFGTGTEPMLGGAIAEAVLNKLNQLGTYGVITTHYTNLKHFGSSQQGIVNGAMLYDAHHMRPLFQLLIGEPGSSFAFEIARKIGLPEGILQEATEKLGKEHIDYDKSLREIVRDKQYWENKRQRIRKVEKNLDTLSDEYQTELQMTRKQRKEIVEAAKKEARQIIDDANRLVEKTIREIRENQAEKEITRSIRKKLVEQKEVISRIDPEKEEIILKRMEQLRQKELNRGKKKQQPPLKTGVPVQAQVIFAPGDQIRFKANGAIGEIIDIDKSKIVVALGNLITATTPDKIEPIGSNEAKRAEQVKRMQPKADSLQRTNDLLNKKLNFSTEIDVRGIRAEEALSIIQSFIDDAIMVRSKNLRILHGKGYGILKEVIRNYLKSEPLVKSFGDEHIQFGGSGITLVELDV